MSGLAVAALSDLMMVQLATCSTEDLDPKSAIQLWHQDSIRLRQPDFMEGRSGLESRTLSDSEKENL